MEGDAPEAHGLQLDQEADVRRCGRREHLGRRRNRFAVVEVHDRTSDEAEAG